VAGCRGKQGQQGQQGHVGTAGFKRGKGLVGGGMFVANSLSRWSALTLAGRAPLQQEVVAKQLLHPFYRLKPCAPTVF